MRTMVLLLLAAALAQDKAKTVEDLDKRTREILQKEISLTGEPMILPLIFFMFLSNHEVELDCYADPAAVPDPAKVTLKGQGTTTLDEALQSGLKASKLVHFVWQGFVVITDEKGKEAFKDPTWLGFSAKDLERREDLAKKVKAPNTFEWSPAEPVKALKEFSEKSGVRIETDALKEVAWKKEKRGMLTPTSTTLWGALACFSRTTGVKFEITKDGGLAAKPPGK